MEKVREWLEAHNRPDPITVNGEELRGYLQKGRVEMEIEATQNELDALIRHLEGIVARYESEAGAFLTVGKEFPGAKERAMERLNEADSAAALLDKLLHI